MTTQDSVEFDDMRSMEEGRSIDSYRTATQSPAKYLCILYNPRRNLSNLQVIEIDVSSVHVDKTL